MMSTDIFIKFLLFVAGFVFLPGKALCATIRLRIFSDWLVAATVHLTVGIALFTVMYLLIRYLQISPAVLWLLPGLSALVVLQKKNAVHSTDNDRFLSVIVGILLIGLFSQGVFLYSGGKIQSDGMYFPEIHDTMWNIAILEKILLHVPPEHPALSGFPLRNNHYFYPAILAGVHQLTAIPVFDLYYRLGPALVSLLFGSSLYAVSTIFTRRMIFRAVSVILGYFSGNISYLLLLVKGNGFNWQGNTFFSDQPFDQIINPYSVLGFVFILVFGYCFIKIFVEDRIRWNWFGISLLLLFVMYGYKSFSGVLAIISVSLTIPLLAMYKRNWQHIFLLVSYWIVFIPAFFIISDPGVSRLHWVPGWILTQMLVGGDKLNMPEYTQKIAYYQMTHDWFGYGKALFVPFIVYTAGNFAVRSIGAAWLFLMILKSKKIEMTVASVFFFIVLSAGFSLPLFFNLGHSTFNIIQFTPYALVIAGIMTGAAGEHLFYYFRDRRMKTVGACIILVLIVLSLPTTLKTIKERVQRVHEKIPLTYVEALRYLRKNVGPDDVVGTNVEGFSAHPIHIPALSGASMYFADMGYVMQTGNSPEHRQRLMDGISDGMVPLSHVRSEGVKYLYLLRWGISQQLKEQIDSENAIEVFKNSDIVIYKL